MPLRHLGVDAEERLAELVDHARAAQLRERVLRRPGRHDRAIGKRVAGPVMIGDDHVEPARTSLRHLCDGGDPAVHRQTRARSPRLRVRSSVAAGDAVALVEPARQVPGDVGSELAQQKHGERRGRDAVDVVVAVDADPPVRRRPPRGSASHARRMSPSRNGSWPGVAGVEERTEPPPGSVSPRRTRTPAVSSLMPRNLGEVGRWSGAGTDGSVQVPSFISCNHATEGTGRHTGSLDSVGARPLSPRSGRRLPQSRGLPARRLGRSSSATSGGSASSSVSRSAFIPRRLARPLRRGQAGARRLRRRRPGQPDALVPNATTGVNLAAPHARASRGR